MKKLISFFTTTLFLCISINSYAQVSQRFFTQSAGTYTEIIGGTLVAEAVNTAAVVAGSLDDANYPSQLIPFTFTYNGTGYTSYNINSNGYITFGAILPAAGSLYTPISNSAAYDGAIAGLGRDIQGIFSATGNRTLGSPVLTNVSSFAGVVAGKFITGTGIPGTTAIPTVTIVSFDQSAGTITMSTNATGNGTASAFAVASGTIRSETTGSAGSRIHSIQFKNFKRFNGSNENLNFQIRLSETSNEIEVVYGSNTTTSITSGTPQVGLRGLTNADFNDRTGTNWATSNPGGTNAATMTLNNSSLPSSGQTYKWGNSQLVTLNLKCYAEGFYKSATDLMSKTIPAEVFLRSSVSPYSIVSSISTVLDLNGNANSLAFNIPGPGTYYIVARNWNMLSTWSAAPQSFTVSGTTNYDFTSAQNQAFGNNMKQVDDTPVSWGTYVGDVNQDGAINNSDLTDVHIASSSYTTGNVSVDLNGDDIIDADDLLIIRNNEANGVAVIKP